LTAICILTLSRRSEPARSRDGGVGGGGDPGSGSFGGGGFGGTGEEVALVALVLDMHRVSDGDESTEVKRAEIEFALIVAIPVEHEQMKVAAKEIERVVQVAIKPKLFRAQRMAVFDLDTNDFRARSAIFPGEKVTIDEPAVGDEAHLFNFIREGGSKRRCEPATFQLWELLADSIESQSFQSWDFARYYI
jgi:hypothetical protein